jgi:MFS family permease
LNEAYQNPKYELQIAIPSLTPARYGLLAGPGFFFLFGTLVLFTGSLADKYTRKYLLGGCAILWSVTSLGMSIANTFAAVLLCRLMLAVFESVCAPCAYSLIADYFPPEVRTTANACFAGCIFVGAAMNSASTELIALMGWRAAYAIVGLYGILVGVLILIFVKEPKRGQFDPTVYKVEETPIAKETKCQSLMNGFLSLVTNPCTRWIMVGSALRMWQATVISFYCITYFNYYEMQVTFGALNAVLILVGGFGSSIICGRICDTLETKHKNYRIKSMLPTFNSLVAVPLFALVFLFHFDFYFSVAILFL